LFGSSYKNELQPHSGLKALIPHYIIYNEMIGQPQGTYGMYLHAQVQYIMYIPSAGHVLTGF